MRPFEEVVARHGPTVLRVCRGLLDPADADDAWSETFLAALRAYPQLRSDSNVEAWLVTIAHRKAIDQRRAAARRPVPVADPPDTASPRGTPVPDASGLPDATLWAALATLPAKQRAAVAYHHLAGLPYAQVAEILGNSEAAARRAAADGIRTLRTQLRADQRQASAAGRPQAGRADGPQAASAVGRAQAARADGPQESKGVS